MKNKIQDPLEELVQSPEYIKGYKSGYEAGYKEVENDMANDFDKGEEYGFKKGNKYLITIMKIANQWNLRELSAEKAIFKVFTYLKKKVKIPSPYVK